MQLEEWLLLAVAKPPMWKPSKNPIVRIKAFSLVEVALHLTHAEDASPNTNALLHFGANAENGFPFHQAKEL